MEFFWENPSWEQQDRHLLSLQQMPFQRRFPTLSRAPGLVFLRGPRQIGKSSWLKTILSAACHDPEIGPRQCAYISCENLTHSGQLAELLASLRDRKLVLLDEISFVPEWWRAVKHEADRGQIPRIVLTGSHMVDLKQGMDLMPGRWAKDGEIFLLPMSFEEYLGARVQAGWIPSQPLPPEQRLAELKGYLQIGGFPTAVAEAGKEGRPPPEAIQTYLRWIRGDVIRLGKNEGYMRELMLQIAETLTTPVSLQTLAQRTSIASHHTVAEYISILEGCFALRTLYALDLDKLTPRFRTNKKFYFTDPLILQVAYAWSGMSYTPQEPKLAELVAHEALTRKYGPSPPLGYLHTAQGEVDFVHRERWAIEVKWAPAAHNLSKTYLSLNWPNKKVWTQANFLS